MRILLTGATGFLGWRTLEKLVELKWVTSITATGRTIKPTHYFEHPKIRYVLGDLSDEHFVTKVIQNTDAIIHTAGLSSPWGTDEEFENANLRPQKLLINAAIAHKIERFVFISTPSLYFELKDKFLIKEVDPLPKKLINQYSVTKHLAEIELENSPIPYVILRPRALTGRGDTVIMPRLIRAYDEGKLNVVGDGKNWVDLTAVSNVVDAIVLSLQTTKGVNQTYNISNGHPVQLWDSIAQLLPLLGRKLPTKQVPYFIAINVARVLEWVSKRTTNKEPALTVYSIGILTKNFTLDITKARELLGFNPTTTTDEAIKEFAEWYLETNSD